MSPGPADYPPQPSTSDGRGYLIPYPASGDGGLARRVEEDVAIDLFKLGDGWHRIHAVPVGERGAAISTMS